MRSNNRLFILVAAVLAAGSILAGCARQPEAHQSFETPEAAVDALVAALEKDDVAQLQRLLGPDAEGVLASGDAVQDKTDRADFLNAYRAAHTLVEESPDQRTLTTGPDQWPMPVPIVRRDGRWYLDGKEGADEIVYRRIGENELGAIRVCRGFVEAQQEYAAEGHDGDPAGIYALKLISDEGLQNGLYWPTADAGPESPAGPFVAAAAAEGYRRSAFRTPYHGYYYRLLYRQGPNASGGAREYFRDGVMTEGFALIAWPADYGAGGIMTFIVNQDGVIFQKNLGEETESAVAAMDAYDPDSSWTAVESS
ncbi:MAG: DUF2950 domain-containing protein [Gammaproteobacteria bacterium]|nr:MAG: DUF2950 domain-containing protein [Gammaproteobacteria bacterium]